jgi:phage terminase large subunit-like protein
MLTDLSQSGQIYGSTAPRIFTRKGPGRSRGPQLVAWATNAGIELLPWQVWLLEHALQRRANRWLRRTILALAARQNGKTRLTTVRVLGGMALWDEEVIGAAQNRDVALESWQEAYEAAEELGLEPWDVHRTNGRESFRIGRKARYKVTASNRSAGRGLHGDLVVLDELREATDWKAYAALEKTRRARPDSQFWSISNEGDMSSIVLRTLAAQGETWKDDPTSPLGFYSWSAAPELERHDPRGWVQANPALGYLFPLDTIEQELRTDPPEVFETEVLCRPVMVLRPYLPEGAWAACQERRQPLPETPGLVCMGVDAGPELRHASICVAWRRPDGRLGVDVAAAFDEAEGAILGRLPARLAELLERWRPPVVAVCARMPLEAAVRRLVPAGTEAIGVGIADLQRASAAFYEAVTSRQLIHMGDPSLDAALAVCSAERPGDTPDRRSKASDIDAARAAILAHYQAATRPAAVKAASWSAY